MPLVCRKAYERSNGISAMTPASSNHLNKTVNYKSIEKNGEHYCRGDRLWLLGT